MTSTFLAYLGILCFEKRCSNRNTVARLKSNILDPRFFSLPNFRMATPLVASKYELCGFTVLQNFLDRLVSKRKPAMLHVVLDRAIGKRFRSQKCQIELTQVHLTALAIVQ